MFSPKTYIVDAAAGTVVAVIMEVGGADFVTYNPGDNRCYTASRDFFTNATQTARTAVLGIIDAATDKWIANIPTATGATRSPPTPSTTEFSSPSRRAARSAAAFPAASPRTFPCPSRNRRGLARKDRPLGGGLRRCSEQRGDHAFPVPSHRLRAVFEMLRGTGA